MALLAAKIFFEDIEFVKKVAAHSTKGKRENAIIILERLQPTLVVYETEHFLCTLGGFLVIPWEYIAKKAPNLHTDLKYHICKDKKIEFHAKLEKTLKLQLEVLLSCGWDFALQYTTDCYLHHANNGFVKQLHMGVLECAATPQKLQSLAAIGKKRTRYTIRLCTAALKQHPAALKKVILLLNQQCLRIHPFHGKFFMRVWTSTQKSIGCITYCTKQGSFRQKQTQYAPKSVEIGEDVHLFHPQDFERILLVVIMHNAWMESREQRKSAPASIQAIWKILHI